ncbi:hypothetical protein CROQUDRAFT_41323 [Cronartium quercuum f. sp. fusiforme G11]|uniref:Cystathionine gamma-synthase n=1 Tax=Cronartium quercuum f. sp. fusiforme G11 TaxID=708437 RepID=A0A9P6NRY3_9BASI|nr:hypothetical protein CROQUDRAFT_41323 [Cronartium quercuum f. sp. fusiforme G11]
MLSQSDPHTASLGTSIPPCTPHAVSVSLPTWQDNVDYELGLDRVTQALLTGYPRFFIHLDIRKLAELCRSIHAITPDEQCMLFPSRTSASLCLEFLNGTAKGKNLDLNQDHSKSTIGRILEFPVTHPTEQGSPPIGTFLGSEPQPTLVVYAVFVPNSDVFNLARPFWQHTGLGISSRFAERCLRLLGSCPVREETHASSQTEKSPMSPTAQVQLTSPPTPRRLAFSGARRHYSVMPKVNPPPVCPTPKTIDQVESMAEAAATYLEERYGRNLPITQATMAKLALRRRIAGVLRDEDGHSKPSLDPNESTKPSERGITQLSESDVYLFPNGMSSIFYAHQACMKTRSTDSTDPKLRPARSICFGFPYTDTLKILQKWGPGAHFFGNGDEADLDKLEEILISDQREGLPPLTALFCEFPTNPLLKSPNLKRIRQLATQYGFLVVIDETVGNFLNVEVLPYADMVVSSLTKLFSGDSNVMGGRSLKTIFDLDSENTKPLYEDTYFPEDAIYMERNSRDFRSRVAKINHNALQLCTYLSSLLAAHPKIIKSIYYPKYTTISNYEACKRPSGGYGGLFSITFTSLLASKTFFDNLNIYKGPSLGTNFTLGCPYVILAHFLELEWAEQFGVDQNLVRVSVGLEETEILLGWFKKAWEATLVAVSERSE